MQKNWGEKYVHATVLFANSSIPRIQNQLIFFWIGTPSPLQPSPREGKEMGDPLNKCSKSYTRPLHERGKDSLLVWAEKVRVSLAKSSLFSNRSSFTFVQKQSWERSSATNCGYRQVLRVTKLSSVLSILENWLRCKRSSWLVIVNIILE